MANQIPKDLPKEARNSVEAIDLQISSITGFTNPYGDYDYALADLVVQLQELREKIIADSTVSSSASLGKHLADHGGDTGEDDSEGLPSTSPIEQVQHVELLECCACIESNHPDNTTTLKCCNTIYCKTCFCEWFRTVLSTKQLPKCCEIAVEPKEHPLTLTRPVHMQYRAVVKELNAERKLWCANMVCRAFIQINQDTIGFVRCTKCRHKTCASCTARRSVHKGRRKMCPGHLTDEILESAIAANEWKRCPKCHVVVEKIAGCNNIRCTCCTMFCFRCGVSKVSETAKCRCSHPRMRFDEVNEDRVSRDELASVNLRSTSFRRRGLTAQRYSLRSTSRRPS